MSDTNFLAGGGEMAALIRSKDWSRTPLGPIEAWPQSLRTAVSLCLASNFPINLIWGPEHTQIYNDGYRLVCGDAHPTALGQGYDVTWASAWPAIGEPFERALKGKTSFLENQRMFLTRNGYLEETFFTFSLSPIRDESGEVGGVFHPVTETTRTMLSERRIRALRDLGADLANVADFDELARRAADLLGRFEYSVPFVLLYRLEGERYVLSGHRGIEIGAALSPLELAPDATAWPIAEAAHVSGMLKCEGLRARLQGVARGPYDEAPDVAFLSPIRASERGLPPAIAILGVSPRLPIDDEYRGFYEMLARSLSAAFGVMTTRNEERMRAEALAAIDRAKTAFFSNVSHEFRTPLTLILGPLEAILAEGEDLAPERREPLEVMRRNCLRLQKLVNSLLDFSRIEAGRVNAHFEPTDLAALTADLASNFRSACERAGLALVVDCPPLSRPVHVDRDMWEKIVLNLLSNAFKFTLHGRIEVILRENEAGVELCVSDTGVGIAAGELPRMFERFHRIEGQRGRTHEGTGIGLSLVRELAALHGGAATVESEPGRGARFRVTLPFGAARVSDPAAETARLPSTASRPIAFVEEALRWLPDARENDRPPSDASQATAFARLARPRVVLADDNADMRDYIRRILEGGGYEVVSAANGVAALAAALQGRAPDIVLSDVMMPELDGFGLLRAIRAAPELQGLPFIMLSARAGEEARIEGLAAGADDYLVKPFSARELRARVDGAIGLAKQRREAIERERAISLELDLRVKQRTRELLAANQRLERRTADLQRANERLSQFSYVASHDLQEPLRKISTFAEVLGQAIKQGDLDEIAYASAVMQRSALRSRQLVRDLLAFSSSANAELRIEPVALGEVVDVVLDDLSEAIKTAKAEVTVEPFDLIVRADKSQLVNLLSNLMSNAIKYHKRDRAPRIRLSARRVADASVEMAVEDEGIGFDAGHSQVIFEPFKRLHAHAEFPGSGVGLAICRTIADRHGWSIDATSKPGVGSRFVVLAPKTGEAPVQV